MDILKRKCGFRTAKGRRALARAVPIWRQTHAAVEALLHDGDADRLWNNLRALSCEHAILASLRPAVRSL